MRRAYLFIYNDKVGSRDEVKEAIDSIPEVVTWRSEIPNSFILVSEAKADELADRIIEHIGGDGLFLITEIPDNSQGLLSERSWHIINERSLPPKRKQRLKGRG